MSPVVLTPYDRIFLEHSWKWLNDPETKWLTLTPDFSREEQERFFRSLPRPDYLIWGVARLDGSPVGAAGLKEVRDGSATYWGYIGETEARGHGLGAAMLTNVMNKARELRLKSLRLVVHEGNQRAIRLYLNHGFSPVRREGSLITMKIEL